jgi:hypothetical protein
MRAIAARLSALDERCAAATSAAVELEVGSVALGLRGVSGVVGVVERRA